MKRPRNRGAGGARLVIAGALVGAIGLGGAMAYTYKTLPRHADAGSRRQSDGCRTE